MEDEYFVADGGRFAAVFDGHGGAGVSQFLKRKLYNNITHFVGQKHWEESDDDQDIDENNKNNKSPPPPSVSAYVSALKAAFEKIEEDVMANDELAMQGSTAVAVMMHESEGGLRTLLSANVGDSRAVLSRNGRAVDLTRDHKPNDEKEKARILAMGESIEWDRDCMVHRVRNLSLARAIGDSYAKPAVSPEVEIKHFPVTEGEDEFVVLASDGLWDVMTSQEAITYVHKQMESELAKGGGDITESRKLVLRRNMAKFLAREAFRKGSSDNISVLMIWL